MRPSQLVACEGFLKKGDSIEAFYASASFLAVQHPVPPSVVDIVPLIKRPAKDPLYSALGSSLCSQRIDCPSLLHSPSLRPSSSPNVPSELNIISASSKDPSQSQSNVRIHLPTTPELTDPLDVVVVVVVAAASGAVSESATCRNPSPKVTWGEHTLQLPFPL